MRRRPLTSWYEIAAHFNRSIRTVQRWERNLHLPIRRPNGVRGIVLADAGELDAWFRSQSTARLKPEALAELELRLNQNIERLIQCGAELTLKLHKLRADSLTKRRGGLRRLRKRHEPKLDRRGEAEGLPGPAGSHDAPVPNPLVRLARYTDK